MMKRILLIILLCTSIISCKQPGTVQDNKGNQYSFNAENTQWMVLNIWATWCPPCIEEMPELNQFYEKHGTRIRVLGANYDNFRGDKLNKAIHRFQIKFPMLQGRYEDAFHMQSLSSIPATFIMNPQGKIMKTLMGPQTVEKLENELKQLGVTL